MKKTYLIILCCMLASCTSTTMDSAPVIKKINGKYDKLATCTKETLSSNLNYNIQSEDMRAYNYANLIHRTPSVIYFKAVFKKDGENTTRLEVQSFPTIQNENYFGDEVIAAAEKCSLR